MPGAVQRRRNHFAYAISAVVLALALAACSSRTALNDREEILRLENVLVGAWANHDVAAIEPMIADDFQYWSYTGERRKKSDILRAVRDSGEAATKVSDPVLRIYGSTAIYTARITDSKKRLDGAIRATETCLTDVFVKRGRQWKLVASHETLMPNSK